MTAGATTSTTRRPRSHAAARRATRRATYPQTPEQIAAANRQHAIEQLAALRREAFEVELNLADLTRTSVRIGEASGWQDARLAALDETITFWRLRYLALTRQISAEGVQVTALRRATATAH